MSYVGWDSAFWDDPDFEDMSPDALLLYIYLSTNSSVRPAGVYRKSLKRIASEETGCRLGKKRTKAALEELAAADKVVFRAEDNLVWVLGWAKRNVNSPKLFKPAVKAAMDAGVLQEWVSHNVDHFTRTDKWHTEFVDALSTFGVGYSGYGAVPETVSLGYEPAAGRVSVPLDTLSETPDTPIKNRTDQNRSDQNTNTSSGEPAGESAAPSAAKRHGLWVDATLKAYNLATGRNVDITKDAHRKPILRAIRKDKASYDDLMLLMHWAKDCRDATPVYNRDTKKDPVTYFRASNFGRYLDAAKEWAGKNKPSPAQQTQMTEHTIDGRTCYEYATFPGWASGTHGWYRRESSGWVKATVAELNAAKEERTR